MSAPSHAARLGRLVPALLAALALTGASRAACAQTPPDPLVEAEAAYSRIDFEAARTHASEALEAGNHAVVETARIYYLLGTANAALHDETAAREAFMRMLALDPSQPVEQNLAPALRASYLEARLYWSGAPAHFGVAVAAGPGGLRVTLADPLHMARAALMRARVPPAQAFAVTRVAVSPTMEFPVGGARGATRVEFALRILDEYGNRLAELGTESAPRSLALVTTQPVAVDGAGGGSWWRPLGWTTASVGVAALAGALVAWRVREARVDGWNSDECLIDGATREENCSARRLSAETAQTWSIVALASGGALLVGGLIMVVAAPSTTSPARAAGFACGPGPGTAGIACGARF